MDKTIELETKYHKLATEYSKVRSHATVLKKAVLDEQAKTVGLKELVKEQEQKIRKHDQEMESLTFRNEQLTKRISVLQQELVINHNGKKSKSKTDNIMPSNFSVIDEELQKKINENAQLSSTLADMENEITTYQEKNKWMEEQLTKLHEEFNEKTLSYVEQISKLIDEKSNKRTELVHMQEKDYISSKSKGEKVVDSWQLESERWKTECDLLRSRPQSNEQLAEYYQTKLSELIESEHLCRSETSSLWAENTGLTIRLEQVVLEKKILENSLEKCNEELNTTSNNYKTQLDAMTEHLAAQNEKITKQCDEIEILNHKLSIKK